MLFQEPEEFLDSVEEIAHIGAARLMDFWRSLRADQVTEKARNDLVTEADTSSERAILEAVHNRFPDHNILSEEAGWEGRSSGGPTWIIDPLDGTTNFVHGIPQFAVSVAVAVEQEVVFGVIVDPVKKDVFRAGKGTGTWWNGTRCSVSERGGLEGALLATGFPFRAHRLLDPYLAIFRDVFMSCKAIRRPGAAALDLAYVACGIFDGFFEFKLSAWDVAAGALMVEEAGGVITDMDGAGDHLSSGNVLCGPEGVHSELLAIVQDHREEWHDAT